MNASVRSSKFHNELKEADIVSVHKKRSQNYLKKIIDLLVFFQIFPRFMKDAYNQMSEFFDNTLHEKYPNTEFFQVCIFPHSD